MLNPVALWYLGAPSGNIVREGPILIIFIYFPGFYPPKPPAMSASMPSKHQRRDHRGISLFESKFAYEEYSDFIFYGVNQESKKFNKRG